VSTTEPPPDLPARDPGLPRFVLVALGAAALLAVWALLRPPGPAGGLTADGGGTGVATVTPAPGQRSGALLFLQEGCGRCHVTAGPSTARGPSLVGLAAVAAARVADPGYRGWAQDARGYLREAIVDHCLDLVPGYDCPAAPYVSLRLSAEEIDRLVEFVGQLQAPAVP
jgi:hypothetical protein